MVAQFVCVYYSRETILTVLDNLDPKLIPLFFFFASSSEEDSNEDTEDNEDVSLKSPNQREDNVPPAKDVKDGQICDGESDQTDKLSPLQKEAQSRDGCLETAVVSNSIENTDGTVT